MLTLEILREQTYDALEFIERKWDDLRANARFGLKERFADWQSVAATSHDGHLGEERNSDPPQILYLPNDFIRPGGRFMVQFYWDSYFVNLSLLESGKTELARGIVENCFHLVEKHGMVISNRKRWSAGSQLPFLSQMVRNVFEVTRDLDWLRAGATFIVDEYTGYWLNKDHLTETGLSRYHAPSCFPAESIAAITIDHEATWDLTPRFTVDDVLNLLPVDLNSNLYAYERDLAFIFGELGDANKSEAWNSKATKRAEVINHLLWDKDEGLYLDYNYRLNARKRVRSLATFFPLFHGIASQAQAARVMENLPLFEHEHGLVTCDATYGYTDRQWNYPLGWAPLHWIAYVAMKRFEYREQAIRVGLKWLHLNNKIWKRTSSFFEKYDVVAGSEEVLSDRYDNQEGFGWTNAVFHKLTEDLCRLVDPSVRYP